MKTIGLLIISTIFFLLTAFNHSLKKIYTVNKSVINKNAGNNDSLIDLTVINNVSLIDLISNKEKYNGKKIRVIGYLNLEFEGNGLYLHKEDYDYGITKNGLWVTMSRDSTRLSDTKKCNKNYVTIEGTFDTMEGHMGAYSGSIKDITRLELANFGTPAPPTNKDIVKFPKHP